MTEFLNVQSDAGAGEVVASDIVEADRRQDAAERNKRLNIAAATRHYALQRAEQRRNGHIPNPGPGWIYKNRERG